jgi:hypothetical protein
MWRPHLSIPIRSTERHEEGETAISSDRRAIEPRDTKSRILFSTAAA